MRTVIAVTFATIATIVPASAQTFECAICDLPTAHVPWPDYAGQAEQEWRQQQRDIEQSYQQSLRDLQQQRLEQQRTQTLLDGLRNLQPNMQPY
jgi:hypothetical protein